MKKRYIVLIVVALLLVAYGVTSYVTTNSDSEKLENGQLKWEGGVDDKYVYSSIIDTKDDGIDWSGRAWVKNSLGKVNYTEAKTDGVGEKGQIHTELNKTCLPGVVNKSGYKDIKVYTPETDN